MLLNSQKPALLATGQARALKSCKPFVPVRHQSRVCASATASAAPEAPSTSASHAQPAPAFKANLDFKAMKDNLETYVWNTKNRFSSADPAKVVELYDQFVKLKGEADNLRNERNENANAMKVRAGNNSVYFIEEYYSMVALHALCW
jgi:seryl-tRNA synthetase